MFIFLSNGFFSKIFAQEKKEINEYYKKAFYYLTIKKYSKTIAICSEILKIDKKQESAIQLRKKAREDLKKEIEVLQKRAQELCKEGKYALALQKINFIIIKDPANPEIIKIKNKLEWIAKLFSSVTGNDKSSEMLRKGINAYLGMGSEINIKGAYNAFVYSLQLKNRKSKEIRMIIERFEKEYPVTVELEKPLSGMNIVENKLQLALEKILSANYAEAVRLCDDVLFLEPNNVMALMRKGSAYYALEKFSQAEKNWEAVLKIDPENKQVPKFLNKLRKKFKEE